jgi:hypothetical protein
MEEMEEKDSIPVKDEFDIAQEAFANDEIVLCPNKLCYNCSQVAGCQLGFENLEEECDTYNLYIESVPAGTLVIASEQPKGDLANGAVADIVNKYGLECPSSSNCGNHGTLSEHGCNGTEEDCVSTCPVPAQCEFCYCEPKSKFNLENDLKELLKIATASL